jgi:hypothetical protein
MSAVTMDEFVRDVKARSAKFSLLSHPSGWETMIMDKRLDLDDITWWFGIKFAERHRHFPDFSKIRNPAIMSRAGILAIPPSVVHGGRSDVLKWAWCSKHPMYETTIMSLIEGAYGHDSSPTCVEMLKYAIENGHVIIKDIIVHGSIDHVKVALRLGAKFAGNECEIASQCAKWDILKFAQASGCRTGVDSTCHYAVLHDNMDILTWAMSVGFKLFNDQRYTQLMYYACSNDNITMVKFLHSHNTPFHGCMKAVRSIEVLSWIRSKGCPWDENSDLGQNAQTIEWAKANGWVSRSDREESERLHALALEQQAKDREHLIQQIELEKLRIQAEAANLAARAKRESELKATADELDQLRRTLAGLKSGSEPDPVDVHKAYRDRCGDLRRLIESRYPCDHEGKYMRTKAYIREDEYLGRVQKVRIIDIYDVACSGIHAGTPRIIDLDEATAFVTKAYA